jgi:hypothetical protein
MWWLLAVPANGSEDQLCIPSEEQPEKMSLLSGIAFSMCA